MTNAAFTILLPHKRNKGNDAALRIALDCLMENTVSDFILISDMAYDEPLYPRVNAMFEQATTDICVYWASDTFAAPAWDVLMLQAWTADTLVTPVLVEPGAIGMHPDNVHKDFGRKPDTFRRADFERWAASDDAPVPDNFGWYAPYMISRAAFLEAGGLRLDQQPDHQGFTPADVLFFEQWQASGRRIQRARSFAYHLQRYSEQDEQTHEKRGLQS